jgi:para-nitrobenzyl esterase
LFSHGPPLEPGVRDLKANHAAEVPYVFNNLAALRPIPDLSWPRLASASEKDRVLAETISSYWVNFAKTGDPNGRQLPAWPQLTRSRANWRSDGKGQKVGLSEK